MLSEVKNPQRTLRIALPTAMGTVTVLYILANIAYVSLCPPNFVILWTKIGAVRRCLTSRIPELRFNHCGFSLQQRLWSLRSSQSTPGTGSYLCDWTPPRRRFYRVYVYSLLLISPIYSNLSNERGLTARVLQELAKDGITPFPNLLMQNRPFKTPVVCLAIHLGITIIFICAPPAGDAFNFVVGLGTYPTVFLLTLVTIGLIKLRLDKNDNFQSLFKVPWAILAFYLAGNIVKFSYSVSGISKDFTLTGSVPPGHAICPASKWKGEHESPILAFPCCFIGYISPGSDLLRRSIHIASLGVWLRARSCGCWPE